MPTWHVYAEEASNTSSGDPGPGPDGPGGGSVGEGAGGAPIGCYATGGCSAGAIGRTVTPTSMPTNPYVDPKTVPLDQTQARPTTTFGDPIELCKLNNGNLSQNDCYLTIHNSYARYRETYWPIYQASKDLGYAYPAFEITVIEEIAKTNAARSSRPAASPNVDPYGYLDGVSCESAFGWAQDANVPSSPIDVHIYIDKPPAVGDFSGFVTSVSANQSRGDLCSAIGSCNHAFSFPIPAKFKDGVAHKVYTYAINSPQGNNPALFNAPKEFKCTTTTTRPNCPIYSPPLCKAGEHLVGGGMGTDGCQLAPRCVADIPVKPVPAGPIAIGQTLVSNGVSVTPLEVTEDSRCPANVTCIWGGTVRVRTKIVYGSVNQEKILTYGSPAQVGNTDREVTLREVAPQVLNSTGIRTSDYRFTFSVSPGPISTSPVPPPPRDSARVLVNKIVASIASGFATVHATSSTSTSANATLEEALEELADARDAMRDVLSEFSKEEQTGDDVDSAVVLSRITTTIKSLTVTIKVVEDSNTTRTSSKGKTFLRHMSDALVNTRELIGAMAREANPNPNPTTTTVQPTTPVQTSGDPRWNSYTADKLGPYEVTKDGRFFIAMRNVTRDAAFGNCRFHRAQSTNITCTWNGIAVPKESSPATSPSNSFGLSDVSSASGKRVDPIPNAVDDEYTEITILLKNGRVVIVRIGFMSPEMKVQAFRNVGYTGDIDALLAMVVMVATPVKPVIKDPVVAPPVVTPPVVTVPKPPTTFGDPIQLCKLNNGNLTQDECYGAINRAYEQYNASYGKVYAQTKDPAYGYPAFQTFAIQEITMIMQSKSR